MLKQNKNNYIDDTKKNTFGEFDKEFPQFETSVQKIHEKDWYIFFSSYLDITLIGCKSILKSKELTTEKKILTISIIFNLRHSFEIILKAFNRSINPKIDKSDYEHDVKKSFKTFKKRLVNLKAKEKKPVKDDLNELEKIIDKYINYKLLTNYIKDNFSLNDSENYFFKYPENSTSIIVNYSDLLGNISKDDIKQIKDDVTKVKMITENIKNLISVF